VNDRDTGGLPGGDDSGGFGDEVLRLVANCGVKYTWTGITPLQ